MARRRAEGHADFAGPDANKEAIETLANAAKKANAKLGHNSGGMVSDETWETHLNLIEAAKADLDAAVEAAAELRGVYRNRRKVAKAAHIDLDAIDVYFRKIKDRPAGEVITENRNLARILRIRNSPLGEQWSLFDEPAEPGTGAAIAEPELAGQHAYSNGEPSTNNPHPAGTLANQEWSLGWHAAQRAKAASMGPAEAVGG